MCGAVFACEPFVPKRDKPVRQKADCSFKNAGVYDAGRAKKAIDLGDGRVVQDIYDFIFEARVIQNCTTGESLVVEAKDWPQDQQTSCGGNDPVEESFAPLGPLDATQPLDALKVAAVDTGHRVSIKVSELFTHKRRRHRADMSCGCKLFYPDSKGAQN